MMPSLEESGRGAICRSACIYAWRPHRVLSQGSDSWTLLHCIQEGVTLPSSHALLQAGMPPREIRSLLSQRGLACHLGSTWNMAGRQLQPGKNVGTRRLIGPAQR